MNKILTIGGYTVRAHIRPIAHPPGHYWLQITSQLAGTRHPTAERELLGLSLSKTQLTKLRSIINLALVETKGAAS